MRSSGLVSLRRSNHKRCIYIAKEITRLLLMMGCMMLRSYRSDYEQSTAVTSRFLQLLETDNVDPAYKRTNNGDNQHNPLHKVDSLCLVHVGKTAGSYVSCRLGLTYAPDCNASMASTSSILAQKTNHYLHLYENTCHRASPTSSPSSTSTMAFLVTVRNPVNRILSWWAYERPKRAKGGPRMKRKRLLWLDCYSHAEDMARDGLMPLMESNETDIPAAVDQMNCRQRAWAAILGERKFGDHNYYNYAYYKKEMDNLQLKSPSPSSSSQTLLVLRTEHLEKDWEHIERLLANKATVSIPNSNYRHLNQVKPIQNQTRIVHSQQAKQNLCTALCEEIQVYKGLLKKSINLSPFEIARSMKKLQQTCPVESSIEERHCPTSPSFPAEKSVKRSYPK